MTITRYYRIDKAGLKHGQFRLTVMIDTGGVIERKDGTARELHIYRERHYPNAHSWRAHNDDEYSSLSECPVCNEDDPECASCSRPASEHGGGAGDFSHCPSPQNRKEQGREFVKGDAR